MRTRLHRTPFKMIRQSTDRIQFIFFFSFYCTICLQYQVFTLTKTTAETKEEEIESHENDDAKNIFMKKILRFFFSCRQIVYITFSTGFSISISFSYFSTLLISFETRQQNTKFIQNDFEDCADNLLLLKKRKTKIVQKYVSIVGVFSTMHTHRPDERSHASSAITSFMGSS